MNKKSALWRLCACVSIALVVVATMAVVAAAQKTEKAVPSEILGAYVDYPAGQTAAKFGDRIRILVNSTTPGGAATCDATLIGGSATDGPFDDVVPVVERWHIHK